MSTITLERGAINYLRDCFHVDTVERLSSEEAASLLDNVEVEPRGEDNDLWQAYCQAFGLDPKQSAEKFRNSKFYREHL